MDSIEAQIAELFRLQPQLEKVSIGRDANDQWSLDLTVPRGSPKRFSIIHTPGFPTSDQAFDHARQLLLPRG